MKNYWQGALAGIVFWFLLQTNPAQAQKRFGNDLPLTEQSNGRWNVLGAYEMSSQSFTWHMQFRSRLTQEDLTFFPEEMHFNFFDLDRNQYLRAWHPMGRHLLRNGYFFEHDPRVLFDLLPNMPNVIMVFAIKGFADFEPVFNIPLAQMCGTRGEDYFRNLSDPEQSCADIEIADLPNSPKQCEALRGKFADWIARGYMSCEEAQEHDFFKGCDLALGTPYLCN